jgi:hypothetical protein
MLGQGFDYPIPHQFIMSSVSCQHLREFMKTQMEVISKHLDEHKYLRHLEDKEEALSSFINDYGWLIREMYCTKICEIRATCEIATTLSQSGDLLSNHLKTDSSL